MTDATSLPAGQARILVVDDSAVDGAVAVAVMQRCGYVADRVTDGLDAIESIRTTDYACIVLDLRMAVFGGEQLVDYLSIDRPDLLPRIVIVSGFPAAAKALEVRVGGIVNKPFNHQQLESAVRACVAKGPA